MKIEQKYFEILKDYLKGKIKPEDIAEKDKIIILKLCKARKDQLNNKINYEIEKIHEISEKRNKK